MLYRCISIQSIAATLCFLFLTGAAHAQKVNNALLKRLADKFVKAQQYKLEKIQEAPASPATGKVPPVYRTRCFGDKEYVLVIAVYGRKPKKQDARMLVMKKQNGTVKFDEHTFQGVELMKEEGVYCSLLQVAFPSQANYLNCEVNLQACDKADAGNKVWFVILSR